MTECIVALQKMIVKDNDQSHAIILYCVRTLDKINSGRAKATMIYNAIFDEIDEGTAMYKVSPNAAHQPVTPESRRFLSLDADGEKLPNDWYLKLADYASRALRKEIVPTPARPIAP